MRRITVTFLGTGDAFGSGGRLQACIMVEATRDRFLVDCGASCLIGMRRLGIDPNGIGTILLSHLHGDHFGGLPFFILDAHFVNKRTRPLVVAGPKGTPQRVEALMEAMFPGSSRLQKHFPLQTVELEPGRGTALGEASVTPYEVQHPSGNPSLAFRIECDGKIIAYSGDTEWTETLIPVAKAADLFITEAYSFDHGVRYHMDVQSLKAHLDDLEPKRLIVTHMGQDTLARLADLPFEHAEDGMVIQL